ncbi:MAG: hypothetical protein ACXV3F_04420 [Frankiaceae bacterium]
MLRQVGDHAGGQRLDSWGLQVLTGLDQWTGPGGAECTGKSAAGSTAESTAESVAGSTAESVAEAVAEAAADCAIGLAADAVGLGDAAAAHRRFGGGGAPDRPVRSAAVACPRPAGLGGRRGGAAYRASSRRIGRLPAIVTRLGAGRRAAPRRESLLFLGVAQLEVARDGRSAAAVEVLRRSAMLAEGLGLLPLVWPARAVLGAALTAGLAAGLAAGADGSATGASAREAQESLDTARATVVAIAADLPPWLRDAWLRRPDIEALFA